MDRTGLLTGGWFVGELPFLSFRDLRCAVVLSGCWMGIVILIRFVVSSLFLLLCLSYYAASANPRPPIGLFVSNVVGWVRVAVGIVVPCLC